MTNTDIIKKNLERRYRKEKRFRFYGLAAVLTGFAFLVIFLTDIVIKAMPALTQHYVQLDVTFDAERLGLEAPLTLEAIEEANFRAVVRDALMKDLDGVEGRSDRRALLRLVSTQAAFTVRNELLANHALLGQERSIWVLADDDVDTFIKMPASAQEQSLRINEKQRDWIATLENEGKIDQRANWAFLSNSDSREAELAGIRGALMGSFYTVLVVFLLAFPLGVGAAIYLEEFAPKNRFTDLIEININNLAAVPSIVFGLLGLAVFINFFGMPRSIPLVGGAVLMLMTLPTIIITSRAAIKSVPPSIKEAALGVGASKMQVVFQHVVPLAMPGILTGAIIGMAQALGETAPLLMIGMVAFIVDVPQGVFDSATVLPVQIFLWADSPERAFLAKTSAAILVLLAFLVVMNSFAVWLRKKVERKW